MDWGSDHAEFLVYVSSALVALPATLFFLYATIHGVILMLRSIHKGLLKSSFILVVLFVTFLITYYYFSLGKLYPRQAELGPSSLFHLQATSSHTFCLVLGVATSQWVKSHTNLSATSRALFNTILLSLFFIGALTWYVVLSKN